MYALSLVDGHLLATLPEGRVLIDTGCPRSFSEVPQLTLGSDSMAIPTELPGFNLGHVRELVHGPLVALLGMDLLGQQPVLFDVPAGVMHVGDRVRSFVGAPGWHRLTLTGPAFGPLVFAATVQNRPCPLVFDTGAQFGYVLDDALLVGGAQPVHVRDFHPSLGWFSSDTVVVDVRLVGTAGNIELSDRMGTLPLRPPMGMSQQIDGFLSNRWLAEWALALDATSGSAWVRSDKPS